MDFAVVEKGKTMRLISCFELKQKLLEERKKIQRMSGETTFGQATIHGIRIALRLMDQCSPQGEIMPVANYPGVCKFEEADDGSDHA